MKKMKKQEAHPFALRAVYLREGMQWMSDAFDPIIPGQQLFAQARTSDSIIEVQEIIENTPNSKTINTCRITLNFEFRYLNKVQEADDVLKDKDDLTNLVAKISASITVDYLVVAEEVPPNERLEQWASSNAMLHSWPYWREFCHSTLLRMNLPVTLMPMLDIKQKKEVS